ncbi:MAG TPA: type II secretion system protein [Armatimonadota bacterium]|nr:type II secretion system protein [Armatimonadota bacterium]
MKTRIASGMTLVELIIVISTLSLVLVAIFSMTIQFSRMYNKSSNRIEPQASLMLALKQLERDLHAAMGVSTLSNGTWLQLEMPKRDATTNLNVLTETTSPQGLLTLQSDHYVSYFLGRRLFASELNHDEWTAVPDPNGDTIFRIESPQPISPQDSAAVTGFAKAPVIAEHVLAVPVEQDLTQPTVENATTIFRYGPDDTGAPIDPNDRLVKVTFTVPIKVNDGHGWQTVNHTLQTQFNLRNLATSGQGT